MDEISFKKDRAEHVMFSVGGQMLLGNGISASRGPFDEINRSESSFVCNSYRRFSFLAFAVTLVTRRVLVLLLQ